MLNPWSSVHWLHQRRMQAMHGADLVTVNGGMDESINVFGVMALIPPLPGFAIPKAVFLKELERAGGES